MSERMSVRFLGRELGTASGWDGDLGEFWHVEDFKPIDGVELIECSSLAFDENNGTIIAQDVEGNALKTWKIGWTLTLV